MSFPTTTQPQEQDTEQTSLAKINALLYGSLPGSGGGSSSIATAPRQYSTVSNDAAITADGTVFTLAAGEKGFIQNINDTAVYVKYGASASSSSFSFVLKAGTADNDGNGGSAVIDDFIGPVSISGVSSTRVIAYKLS